MTDLCSTVSRRHDEPISATASRVERWLLVEQPGAWGPPTVPSGRMPPEVAQALARTANAARARLVLIRRPHVRGSAPPRGRAVFWVDSRPGAESVRSRVVHDDAELLALDPTGDGWQPVGERLWLVCTHGRHDRCCAVRGRPVAQALRARFPDTTWECTHVGGDRFAANVVVMPDGLYLGQVEVDEAVPMVEALLGGTLPRARVRGRSSLSLPAQAAQSFAREATGRWGVEDLLPVEQAGAGPDAWRIVLGAVAAAPSGVPSEQLQVPSESPAQVVVVVRYDRHGDGEARLLTCGAEQDKLAPVFRLESLA